MARRPNARSWEDEKEEEDYGPEDNSPYDIPELFRTIDAERRDITIRELWDKYKVGNVILQPSFQRNYVWDEKKASRYVESLLLRLPTPPVFVAEETSGQWTVIDGHQRLASLFRFMKHLLDGPAGVSGVAVPWGDLTTLKLQGLEVIIEINGMDAVAAIPIAERDGRLWQLKIPIVKLGRNTGSDMKYVLFERLNLGSLSLNNQELRNCMYRGPYNELLIELSKSPRYLSLWKKPEDDKRMKDRERVLRFFAFMHRIEKYAPPLKKFLNDEMKENQDAAPEVLARFRQEFASALLWVERIWGDESFKQYKRGTESNPKGHWVRSRYDLIYDVEMIGFGQYGPHLTRFWDDATPGEHTAVRKLLRNRLATVMMGDAFVASMLEGTWRHSAVANRYDPWLHSLEIIVRDFKRAINDGEMLDQTWRDNNNACQICKTPVPIEEAVLIGLGDKKSVVHQYCSRPR